MKLLTKANLKALPLLYSQEKVADPVVPVKFFNPAGAGSWFAVEFDGTDIFYGYVTGLAHDEMGNFSLAELSAFRGRFGLGIERDMHWDPKTKLSDVMSGKAR